jgi:hypothetical protein
VLYVIICYYCYRCYYRNTVSLSLRSRVMDEQQADDIESEEELAHQKRMVCAVIQRLITKERWVIILNDDEVCVCV